MAKETASITGDAGDAGDDSDPKEVELSHRCRKWIFTIVLFCLTIALVIAFAMVGPSGNAVTTIGNIAPSSTNVYAPCKSLTAIVSGDYICDDELNTQLCLFDGGDCCSPNSDCMICSACKCHQNNEMNCGRESGHFPNQTGPRQTTQPSTTITTTTTTTITTTTTTTTTTTSETFAATTTTTAITTKKTTTTTTETAETTTTNIQPDFPDHPWETIVVTQGDPFTPAFQTEVFNLAEESLPLASQCSQQADSQQWLHFASGGFLGDDHRPLICGGYVAWAEDKCYLLGESLESHTLTTRRISAGSLILDRDDGGPGKRLWLVGGYGHIEWFDQSVILYKDSTEYVQKNGDFQFKSQLGPSLPNPLTDLCLVRRSQTEAMVIGGRMDFNSLPLKTTLKFDMVKSVFEQGPQLMYRRVWSSCGTVKLGSTGETLTVIAGGHDGDTSFDSVEFLAENSDQWVMGPAMPLCIVAAPGVTISTGLLLIGGQLHGGQKLDTIYLLQCDNSVQTCSWTLISQHLEVARSKSVALVVPDCP